MTLLSVLALLEPATPDTSLSADWVVKAASIIVIALQVWLLNSVNSIKSEVQRVSNQVFGPDGNSGLTGDAKTLRDARHDANNRLTKLEIERQLLAPFLEPLVQMIERLVQSRQDELRDWQPHKQGRKRDQPPEPRP